MLNEVESLRILRQKISGKPDLLLILGSGWKGLGESSESSDREFRVETEIPYKELFGVEARVPGHEGRLVIGRMENGEILRLSGGSNTARSASFDTTQDKQDDTADLKSLSAVSNRRVAVMMGRLHVYEGYTGEEATLPIRVLAHAGVKQMIVTSACGALNPEYKVGDFVVLSDMLSLFLRDNPLKGPEFVDMSASFDKSFQRIARSALRVAKARFHEGVYAYYPGPNYETPADKRALRTLGADVVGMSTVPEVIMGAKLKLKMLGLSLVTNLAFVKHDHKEVLEVAEKSKDKMARVLRGIISKT